MSEWAIESSALSRSFGRGSTATLAVDRLDLRIAPATIYGFLGPNGCGKSTAIRLLTGLLEPNAGSAKVLGYDLPRQAEELRRHIGYMTQKFSLYDNLSVSENLQFVARIHGLKAQQRQQRCQELLELHDLTPNKKQLAGSMSGGQRQRLALAAATLNHPDLLFLDEPTSAVDPENRREFWEHLFDLCQGGTSILVTTHYMDEAERCHALAILENGQKRADGSPMQLMNNMGAKVFEMAGSDLRVLKADLVSHPQILSAAQLGSRLRVLVRDNISKPQAWLAQAYPQHQIEPVRPSLEDVFVTCTGQHNQECK